MSIFKFEKYDRQIIFFTTAIIFILANYLISFISFRLDLSNGKAYTLSDSTKKLINNLDDVVNIKFYVSSDLPTRLLPLKSEVIDLLNEYKSLNRGKILIKVLDPKKDRKALSDAKESGIPELSFSQLDQDKYAVTSSYFGMEMDYGNKKEIIPQLTDFESLEYNLSASIYKMVKKELSKIGIVGQVNFPDPQQDQLATLKNIIGKQFDINYLNLSDSSIKSIDQNVKTILLFDSNNKEYNENEIGILKNYLDKGGKALIFIDGIWISDNLSTTPAKSNLFSLVEDFGITVKNNLILSTSASLVNFGNTLLIPYPFWLRTNVFNKNFSYFSNIGQLTFPWVSSIDIKKKSGAENEYLIKTGNRSWEQKGSFNLNPQGLAQPNENDFKQFVIGAISGRKNGGKIAVIPSSRFILEKFLGQSTDNVEFVLNILNDLASDGALSGIRSRTVSFYPLPDLPENQKDIFRYLNIFLLPALFTVLGAYRLIKRR